MMKRNRKTTSATVKSTTGSSPSKFPADDLLRDDDDPASKANGSFRALKSSFRASQRRSHTRSTTAGSPAGSSNFSLSDDLPDDPPNDGSFASRGALTQRRSYTTSTTITGTSDGSSKSFSAEDLLLDDPSNDGTSSASLRASSASLRGLNMRRGSSKNASFRPSQRKSNSLEELTINKLNFDKVDICGRDAEIKQLNQALEDAKQKKQLVLLAGYSGTGTPKK
jgi:hypothetical protein